MVRPSSDGNSHKRKKHKKIPARAPPTNIPGFLRTVGTLYPKEYLTASGNVPRKYKGSYCCQLFSRVRLGDQVSQQLRTRTVSVGFRAATTDDKRDTFQSKIDEAVDHLSRVYGTSPKWISPSRTRQGLFQVVLVIMHR